MNKTLSRQNLSATRVNAASWVSSCPNIFSSPCFSVKSIITTDSGALVEPLLKREGLPFWTEKRGEESCLYAGVWRLLDEQRKQSGRRGRRQCFITRANAKSWFSSCSAPSQPLLNPLLSGEIPVWLWALKELYNKKPQFFVSMFSHFVQPHPLPPSHHHLPLALS